jgi:CheY-like chemotaxis protein
MRHVARPSSAHVLIVEDDRAIRDVMAEVLVDHGYEVDVATNGQQALEICRSKPTPDLILLDLLMPVMDGLEFARLKRSDPTLSRVPLCVMTASGPLATIPEGVSAVLRKPISCAELIAVVARLCQSGPTPTLRSTTPPPSE